MHYLIIENVALKPHLETAGEIALRLRDEGHNVSFCWVGSDLPWSDWKLPPITKFIGCSLTRRVNKFLKILYQEGIRVVDHPDLENIVTNKIYEWAASFDGDIEDLKKYAYTNARLGMGAASSIISFYGDSLIFLYQYKIETKLALVSSALVYERSKALIHQEKPDAVITFNGRFATSKPVVAFAESLGIPVLRHERGSTYDRYEIFSDAIHNYKYIRERIKKHWEDTPREKRVAAGHNFYIRRRGGDGIGWHSFTKGQRSGYFPSRQSGKKRIVYFSSSDDEYAAVTDSFEIGPWDDQLSAVRELVDICSQRLDIELVIRVHPHLIKKSPQERMRWSQFHAENICLIPPKEAVDSYALLDSADVVVSYGSTMGMEAAYWGKPSILLGPCSYAETPPVITIKSRIELNQILTRLADLCPPNRDLCLPYGNYYLSYGKFFCYYKPISLSEGFFLGERLGWDPWFIYYLRKFGLGKLWRKFFGR
jgi:hypothetical protein